ncbi:MAG: response regulator transcription factor [Chloroflexota bacterium]|nr:response regulator transcription factor [Chloroflexota bacterium]
MCGRRTTRPRDLADVTKKEAASFYQRPITTLVVDDHPVVRAGLCAVLANYSDVQVIGEASDGIEAIQKAKELQPDVLLMDLRMPHMDGAQAMRHIKENDPESKFVVLTTYDTDEHIFRGIEAGARAFLLKDSPPEDLVHAIRTVYNGDSLIQPTVASRVLDRLVVLSNQAKPKNLLSDAEMDIIQLMVKGATNKEIAAQLYLSESTVKVRVTSIFEKLGVEHRTEAVAQALQRGIVNQDSTRLSR